MDVNSVSSATATYAAYSTGVAKEAQKTEEAKESAAVQSEEAAVYEKSDEAKAYKPDMQKVQQMLADSEARVQQFRDMIQKMFGQQAKTSDLADGIWQKLASGDFTVDAATKAQAQADVSEDGYWGVKQTSERILDFAKTLAGNDPEKLEKMRSAFEKGYKQAEKTWGGELPEISRKTYDAVMKGFDELKNGEVEA
ncbi:MAG: hypothetical protein IK016_10635 [Lachnospiraceae bacterium]|nr:hypothetical protein [Lachnospiraceae bacterium]